MAGESNTNIVEKYSKKLTEVIKRYYLYMVPLDGLRLKQPFR